ncbi:MAG: hypothetical protein ACYTGN_10615 [Planctomycetota bacterium]
MRQAFVCLLIATLGIAAEPPGGFYKNTTWGFKVRVPKDWSAGAVPATEMWIASKHLGKRELEAQTPKTWDRMRPEMWVIGFPKNRKVGEAYEGYEEYVKKHVDIDWGMHDFTKKTSTTIDGVKVSIFEIGPTKESREVPRKCIAWVYHFDDIDFAIHFQVFEMYFDNYESSFRGCMKSFKRIKRKRAIPGTEEDTEVVDLSKMTPEELERHERELLEKRFRSEIDALGDGWKHKRSANFLVLSNANKEFTRETTVHAEAVRAHLDKFLGDKQPGYIKPAIIRIFPNDDARNAYSKNAEGTTDILIAAGHGWEKDNALESVNRAILAAWLKGRHELLPDVVPGWMATALNKYMDMVRTKGKRIIFSHEDWDRDQIRLDIKKGEVVPVAVILGAEKGDATASSLQTRNFGYWLLTKGNRGKYKDLVRKYIAMLLVHIRTAEQEQRSKVPEDKKDSVEIDEWVAAEVKTKLPEVRQGAFDDLFQSWKPKDWAKFHKLWLSHAK